MYNLTKKEKLDFIKQQIENLKISAYTISKKINLTEAGIGKILNGTVKNPHESTLDILLLYLEDKVLGSELNKVEEHPPTYEKEKTDLEGYYTCLQDVNKLTREVIHLQGLLRKNNIDFKNIFEEE